MPNDFMQNELRINGQSCLKADNNEWPKSVIPALENIPERRKATCLLITTTMRHLLQMCHKYSIYTKLIRIIATCFRFLRKSKSVRRCLGDFLDSTVYMSNKSESAIIKIIQNNSHR